MNDTHEVERRLASALRTVVADTPTRPRRALDLDAAVGDRGRHPVRRWAPALLAAAAVAAIVVAIVLAGPRTVRTPDTATDLKPGQVELVDGLRITPPAGLTLTRLAAPSPNVFALYCLTSKARPDADCANGIQLSVAHPDGYVPGGPAHMCSTGATIPTATSTTIDGLPAELWTIRCGSSPVTSRYWALASAALAVQQPIDGSLSAGATQLVDSIDTRTWVLRTAATPLVGTTSGN